MKRRPARRSHRRLKIALVILVVVALVGVAAFAEGLLPITVSRVLAGVGLGSKAGVPQSSLHWPQNSSTIIDSLCSSGSALFWVPQNNFTGTIQVIGQQMLTACAISRTGGGIVTSQRGLYLYSITVEGRGTTVNTSTATKTKR